MNTPFGKNIRLYISGGSHDDKISMRLEGFPRGVGIDFEELARFMERRAPGRNDYSTARREADKPEFSSGFDGKLTNGDAIEAVIYNNAQRSSDYNFKDTPRPSHADFAALMKYGSGVDLRGGGHFSGRLTALTCVAGGICLQYLAERGVRIFAHIYSIGDISDTPFDMATVGENERRALGNSEFPVLNGAAGERMRELISGVKRDGDSVGGIVECALTGLPAGVGEHMFDSLEAEIAQAVFAVPAVKGIEFGSGFSGSAHRGSENNDPFVTDGKTVRTLTNNSGGILGGMSDGMPVVFRAAFKPTPSIAMEQRTVSLSKMENVKLSIGGRHDPCIVPRAVPVIEAAAAIAIVDLILGLKIES